jgi:hypothetical protein
MSNEFHQENSFSVPEHSSHILSDGESLLELLVYSGNENASTVWIAILFLDFFLMNPCLVPCDNLLKNLVHHSSTG